MRYTKYIALWAILFAAVACTNFEFDIDGGFSNSGSASCDVITIHGSVARFSDYEVGTRANKTPEESYVSNMVLAVFPVNNDGTIGKCVNYVKRTGDNLLYALDRSRISKDYANKEFVLYIFANMPDMPSSLEEFLEGEDPESGSLDKLLNKALNNPNITRPDGGFPMIGSLGDVNRDGNTFVLMPMANVESGKMDLPKVNGTPTDYLNIPMKAIFAKMSFEIFVASEEDVAVNNPARFEMTDYVVHNIPTQVSFNETLNKENQQEVSADSIKVTLSGIAQGGEDGGGSSIAFDFYLPERLLTPNTLPEQYRYPLGDKGVEVVGYSNIPADHKKYAQRYKPKLLGNDQQATYVTIHGKYRDHQEIDYNVEYNIYLGADNYGDFNINRNGQYINKITIKGITSSVDQVANQSAISIDHRVNVERSIPVIISLRRETQLDAHYEVRPMRMRFEDKDGNGKGDIVEGATITVQVLKDKDSDTPVDWVRVELSGETGEHITTPGLSYGKRKYFTTDLMEKLNTEVIVTDFSSIEDATVWVYVDEAPYDEATENRTSRTAVLKVTYNDGKNNEEIQFYYLRQFNLHMIKGKDNPQPYYIECYEEYLYNYDSEDIYGQIREEGLPWGLDGVQLSNKHASFTLSESNNQWKEYVENSLLPVYDFYIGKHDAFAKTNGAAKVRDFAGQEFTDEIVKTANIQYLTMAEQAANAVQYCYNRNKRNADGSVDVKWYLPSADELEDFIVEAYSYYEEFQDNYYWTSQPAYIRNIFYYQYQSSIISGRTTSGVDMYIDNTGFARATKVDDDLNYIGSGLNKIPDPYVNRTGSGEENRGYFYEMPYWKRVRDGLSLKTTYGTFTSTDEYNIDGGQEWDDSHDDVRYHAHLGHLDDLKQDGYRDREEPHRVRCAYRP